MFTRTLIAASLLLTGTLAISAEASARNGWQRSHPARSHINHRIARQQVRITREVRQGDMSRPEARSLRKDLHSVRMQERAYAQANANNGHLNRGQVKDLNRQLNQSSRAIGH